MGGVPDQVEGCEPNNDDDKDGKMDKETAQRRFCETELVRRILVRFNIRRPFTSYPTSRVHRKFSPFSGPKDWSSRGNPP